MIQLKQIEIPQEVVDFANGVAALADKCNIDSVSVNITPEYLSGHNYGSLNISYDTKDGRGRPCKNLCISVQSTTKLQLVSNPSSFN